MGYFNLYYALLDLKKVVIYPLCILTTRFFYFAFLASLHIFCFSTIENHYLFLFFPIGSLLLVCTIWTQSNANIDKGNYNLQNPNICPRFFIIVIFTKKKLLMFCATNDYSFKKFCMSILYDHSSCMINV
jgi:hypothetical protein